MIVQRSTTTIQLTGHYLHCYVLLLKDPHNAYATKQQNQ